VNPTRVARHRNLGVSRQIRRWRATGIWPLSTNNVEPTWTCTGGAPWGSSSGTKAVWARRGLQSRECVAYLPFMGRCAGRVGALDEGALAEFAAPHNPLSLDPPCRFVSAPAPAPAPPPARSCGFTASAAWGGTPQHLTNSSHVGARRSSIASSVPVPSTSSLAPRLRRAAIKGAESCTRPSAERGAVSNQPSTP